LLNQLETVHSHANVKLTAAGKERRRQQKRREERKGNGNAI